MPLDAPTFRDEIILLSPRVDQNHIRVVHAAMMAIAAREAAFVSRGDDSGTHAAEMVLWADAEIAPKGAW